MEKSKQNEKKTLVRHDLVAYYKEKIALGEYVVRSSDIAEKMVQKIKEQPIVKQRTHMLIRN